jgi:hypothetical protein
MAISHRGYITKLQTKRETLILCHWWGLTQNSFGLNFYHLMIFFFQNGENQGIFFGFSSCQISKINKSSDCISSYNM